MPATDIKLAGLEPGCKVTVDAFDDGIPQTGRVRDITDAFGKLDPDGRSIGVDMDYAEPAAKTKDFRCWRDDVMRDYADAQAARQKRFGMLFEHFVGDINVPDASETLERFTCISRHATTGEISYAFGDTFEDCVYDVGGEILDGWMPQAAYDLDTGTKIELHYSSPVITRSEDQGVTVNELEPEQMVQQAQFVATHYEHVGDTFTVSLTVSPTYADVVAHALKNIRGMAGVEDIHVSRTEIRQYISEAQLKTKEASA